MIERWHREDGRLSTAFYSECLNYRYALTRAWGAGPKLTYIMLNPSKASEVENDPTVHRCERRARALGYSAFRVCNLFAWCETDPAKLKKATAPIGPENDVALLAAAKWSDAILCGWGNHGAHMARGTAVLDLLKGQRLQHLGLTKLGHPRHPLYVAYAQQPESWGV
ncbi:MAG: DUF1643 domain-containing protein [Planctomycetota bacterium]